MSESNVSNFPISSEAIQRKFLELSEKYLNSMPLSQNPEKTMWDSIVLNLTLQGRPVQDAVDAANFAIASRRVTFP
jgi:hypothetical protein